MPQAWHVPDSFVGSLRPPLGQLAGYPQAVVAVLLPHSDVPVPQPYSTTPASTRGAAAKPMAKPRPEPASTSTSSAPAALATPAQTARTGSDSSRAGCQTAEQHGFPRGLPEAEPAAAEAAQVAVGGAGLAGSPSGPCAVAGVLGTLAGLCCAALSSGPLLKSATQRVLGGRVDAEQLQDCGQVRGPPLRCCMQLLMAAQYGLLTFHAEGSGAIKSVALLSTCPHHSMAAAKVTSLFSRAAS